MAERRPRRWALGARLLLLVSLSLSLPFCGKADDPGSSESHFLNDCTLACADGLECLCGVCTRPCDVDVGCGELSAEAECLADFASANCAGSGASPGPACDVSCQVDEDCQASEWACVSNRCRKATSCAAASQRARLALASALGSADRACAGDADCSVISADSACSRACPAALSSAGIETVQAAVANVDAEICAGRLDAGCEVQPPKACERGPSEAVCRENRCELAGALLAGCVQAVESVTSGGACAAGCNAYDGCCSQGATCTIGTAQLFTSNWDCQAALATTCTSSPNSTLSGTTPLGEISLGYGWGSFSFAFAVDVNLIFTTSSPASTCAPVRLGAALLPTDSSYVGVHVVLVTLFAAGERAVALGRFEITQAGDLGTPMTGTLTVTDAGWDFSGDFTISACDDLDRSGP